MRNAAFLIAVTLLVCAVPIAASADLLTVSILGCPATLHRGETLEFTVRIFNEC